jgi:hypothetical protein
MQLIFYCWLQACSTGDLTSEWLDTSVLMTSVYCCRFMMGWTHLPKKLVATALPLHWLYTQHQITCSSNSVQTYLLVDEVSISVTKQVRVRLLPYIWLAVLFVLEKIYFSVLDKWGRKAKIISQISQGQYLALIFGMLFDEGGHTSCDNWFYSAYFILLCLMELSFGEIQQTPVRYASIK